MKRNEVQTFLQTLDSICSFGPISCIPLYLSFKASPEKYFLMLIAVEEIGALQASAVPQEGIPGAGSATAGA